MKKGMRTLISIVFVLGACDSGLSESTASQNSELTPFFYQQDCNRIEREKITAARKLLAEEIASPTYSLTCMQNHLFTSDGGSSVEMIFRQLEQTSMPVLNRCSNNLSCQGAGEDSAVCFGSASLQWNKTWLAAADSEDIALRIAEAMLDPMVGLLPEQYQYTSDVEHNYSVRRQMPDCLINHSAFGPNRMKLADQVELAAVGNGKIAGVFFEHRCPGDRWSTGIPVDSPGLGVTVHCRSAGEPTGIVLGTGSQFESEPCPAGQVMIGMRGVAGDKVYHAEAICRSIEDAVTSSDTEKFQIAHVAASWSLNQTLSSDRSAFARICPDGMAVKGVRGRRDGAIRQLRLICESLDAPQSGMNTFTELAGASKGYEDSSNCQGAGFITGIYGLAGNSHMPRLGAKCRTQNELHHAAPAEDHITPGRGSTEGDLQQRDCPEGTVMIGLSVNQGNAKFFPQAPGIRVRGLLPRCGDPLFGEEVESAPFSDWSSWLANPSWATHVPAKHLLCPKGEAVHGLKLWTDSYPFSTPQGVEESAYDVIRGVRVICKPLPLNLGLHSTLPPLPGI
jgi:hypothetical protein